MNKNMNMVNEQVMEEVNGGVTVVARKWGYVTVKAGDNLYTIAANHGITLNQLLEKNPQYRANPGFIMPGWQVFVPVGYVTINR